jgi:hypothetical protein
MSEDATAFAMEESTPILDYAESLDRERLTIDRGEGVVRVIVPPPRGWRELSVGLRWGAGVLAALLILYATAALVRLDVRSMVMSVATWGGPLLIVLGIAFDRLHQRVVLELSGPRFSVTRVSPFRGVWTRAWRRDAIGEVKLNRAKGNLIIRVTGREFVEVFLSGDRAITTTAASVLDEALRAPAAGPVDPLLPAGELIPPDELPKGLARRTLLAIAVFIAVGGVLLGVYVHPAFAVYMLILAAAPVGIALGAQRKEYYM